MPSLLSFPAVRAGALYFLIMFGIGFVLGTIRVLFLVPATGEMIAVLIEGPVMLTLSWFVSLRLTGSRPDLAGSRARLAMGSIAFFLLILAEFILSLTLFAQTPAAFVSGLQTPHGLLGLTGQIIFGLIPWLQRAIGANGSGN